MKIKTLLLTFVFAFAITAFAETVTIYQTNFDDLPGSNAVEPSEYPNLIAASSYIYPETLTTGGNALRFASSKYRGSFTSVAMNCTPNAPITFTFDAAKYDSNVNESLRITIDSVSKEIPNSKISSIYTDSFTQGLTITFEEGVTTDTFSFTIDTFGTNASRARLLIDNLTITQEVPDGDEPDPVQLEAPKDLAVANLTHKSATASWTAVTNAKEYSVILATGETETTNTVKTTSIDFTDLSAQTTYSVKVAAVGNGTTYLTSEYSSVPFTTEAAPVGEWKVLFDEDFSLLKTGDHTSTSNNGELTAENAPWAKLEVEGETGDYYKVNQAGGAVKFSTASIQGFVTTTNLVFSALPTRITAYVKGWTAATPSTFDVVINGTPYSATFPQAFREGSFAEVVIEIPSVTPGSFPVKITSTNGGDYRFFLDSFKVEQFASSTLTQLPAPADLTATVASCYSANISWAAVTGALSYSVTIQAVDADGNNVGDPIVKPIGNTETSVLVEGLQDGTSYNVSVVAIGDGAASLDSDAATASFATAADIYKPTFTVTDVNGTVTNEFTAPLTDPIVVNVSAVVGEEVATVVAGTMPEGATFVDGVFTWTPMTEEVGTVVTVDFTVTNEGGTYTKTVPITIAEALPLTMGAITASDVEATSAILSWDALPKATSYTYDIWYGSSIVTNGVDMETFFDFEGVRKGVIPFDVTINGANGTYADNKDFDFDHNVICFNGDTGYVITKQYPKAVTNLSAYFVKKSAGTEEGFTGNPVTVYASSDDGATWVQVASYAAADLAADEVRVFEFDAASNYTRFKFEWQKVEMNFGISCIAATYTGAGTKMFAENQTTTDTSISIPKGLVANTEYIVRIKASNDAGDSEYKYFRFATKKAKPGTVIILQ